MPEHPDFIHSGACKIQRFVRTDSAQCLAGFKIASLYRLQLSLAGSSGMAGSEQDGQRLAGGSCRRDLMKTSLCVSHPCASPCTPHYRQREGLRLARPGLICPRQHPTTIPLLIIRQLCLQLPETLPPLFNKFLLFLQRQTCPCRQEPLRPGCRSCWGREVPGKRGGSRRFSKSPLNYKR